jgi:hypothetical protein
MDQFDQFPSLAMIGEQQVAARVDYQVCSLCGFRLVRVETTIINDQQLIVQHCPICNQSGEQNPTALDLPPSREERQRSFEIWLASHGLDRDVLVYHYHLTMDDFFDPVE